MTLDPNFNSPGPVKGDVSPYDAPFRHNPGTRITLTKDSKHTQKGILDQPFVFPAPPLNQLQIALAYNWGDYDTISAGQFSRPSSMQLTTIQFDSIIVADDYPWVFYNPLRSRGLDIDEMGRELGKILRSGSPFNFKIEEARFKPDSSGLASSVTYDFGTSPVLTMLATLRTLSKTKQAGEPDALYITCGFTEHRIAGTTEKKLGSNNNGTGAGGKGGEDSRSLPTSLDFSSLSGSLQDLAVKYYGSAARWTYIRDSNPWLGSVTATHDLSVLDTAALKTAAKSKKKLTLLAVAGGGRT